MKSKYALYMLMIASPLTTKAVNLRAQAAKLMYTIDKATGTAKKEIPFTIKNEITIKNANHDDLFHHIITTKIFNPEDTTPLKDIVLEIIDILKAKQHLLEGNIKIACKNLIKLLEKHVNTKDFETWVSILQNDDFLDIIPEETRQELEDKTPMQLGMVLLQRLENA